MDCSMPGLPVPHNLLGFAQVHVHRVGNDIQPSHPLSSPSPPAFNLSQHQGLFQRVSSLCQVAKVLELQLQHQSFQWRFRKNWPVWSPCCPRDFQESSPAPQFKSTVHVLFQNTTLKWNIFNIQFNVVLVLLNPNTFVMLWKNPNKLFGQSFLMNPSLYPKGRNRPSAVASLSEARLSGPTLELLTVGLYFNKTSRWFRGTEKCEKLSSRLGRSEHGKSIIIKGFLFISLPHHIRTLHLSLNYSKRWVMLSMNFTSRK